MHNGHAGAKGPLQGNSPDVRPSAGTAPEASGSRRAAPALPGLRVLLVEDHPAVREMTRALLETAGYTVLLAEDGLKGVEAVQSFRPDAALVDISLPKLSGYEVARRIRQLPGGDDHLLIAVTGYGQPEDRQRALDAGFNAHLVKPIELTELADLLNQAERPGDAPPGAAGQPE